MDTIGISTHVPTRGTTIPLKVKQLRHGISTHVPTRGTTIRFGACRGEPAISTHVPTRGTTRASARRAGSHHISTHVPTRGTTGPRLRRPGWHSHFNPRPHAGDDIPCATSEALIKLISTHVPTRGTTRQMLYKPPHQRISTHVPTRGTTLSATHPRDELAYFNPRPHAGDDSTNHQKQRNYSSAYPIFSVHCAKQTIKNPILLFLCVPQFPQL